MSTDTCMLLVGFLCNDVNNTTHSIATIQSRTIATNNFNAFYICKIDTAQLIGIHCRTGVFGSHTTTVNQNQRMLAFHTANHNHIAGHANLLHINVSCKTQGIAHVISSSIFDILLGDNLNALRNLFFLQLCLGSGNNVIRTAVFIVIICLRSKCHMADCTDNAGSE